MLRESLAEELIVKDVPFLEIVCERGYDLRRQDGTVESVLLQVGLPVALGGQTDVVACPFRLVADGKQLDRMYQVGVDSLQALVLTLQILPVWLKAAASSAGGTLEFQGKADLVFDPSSAAMGFAGER